MKLQSEPFEKIKSGFKKIEIRLFDEKRKFIKEGDIIEFFLVTDSTQKITTKVVGLFRAKTFDELFEKFSVEDFGMKDKEELESIYKIYSRDDELKYGVVGIKIQIN